MLTLCYTTPSTDYRQGPSIPAAQASTAPETLDAISYTALVEEDVDHLLDNMAELPNSTLPGDTHGGSRKLVTALQQLPACTSTQHCAWLCSLTGGKF